MKTLLTRIIAALFVVGVLAGCASTSSQESVMDYLDRTYDTSSGD